MCLQGSSKDFEVLHNNNDEEQENSVLGLKLVVFLWNVLIVLHKVMKPVAHHSSNLPSSFRAQSWTEH